MSTAIHLDDVLVDAATKLAEATGRSVTAVVEDALREKLAQLENPSSEAPFSLITFGEGGVRSGIDLSRFSSLLDEMESTP